MRPEELATAVRRSVAEAVDAGDLAVDVPAQVRVERPSGGDRGDWSTNVALQLAQQAGMPPRHVAARVADRLGRVAGVCAVDIAGPGFLNITLDAGAAGELARKIVEAGATFGQGSGEAGKRISLEFVSANLTGPIHLGGTRWAAVGDSLARILTAAGAEVTREYCFNDHGAQVDRFARSLLAAARGEATAEDGYVGSHVTEIAATVVAAEPGILDLPDLQAQERFRALGVDLMFTQTKASLHDFGVDFDVYVHEHDLHKDRVVVKLDGEPAYLSVDLVRDGQPVRMSKRAGTVVVLEDLVAAVGVDAARYALTRSSTDSQIDVDLDLLVQRRNENPVFYVQYTHARTCSVTALATADGVYRADGFDPALLTDPTEAALLAALGDFPRVVALAARLREPHRVARYLEDLAGHVHAWYDTCPVRPMGRDDEVTDLHRTRLWLNDATRQVIVNGLGLLGVSASERM